MPTAATAKRFTVVCSFTGECCAKAHLWVQSVPAGTARQARTKVLRELRRAGGDPTETLVFTGSLPPVLGVTEVQEQ